MFSYLPTNSIGNNVIAESGKMVQRVNFPFTWEWLQNLRKCKLSLHKPLSCRIIWTSLTCSWAMAFSRPEPCSWSRTVAPRSGSPALVTASKAWVMLAAGMVNGMRPDWIAAAEANSSLTLLLLMTCCALMWLLRWPDVRKRWLQCGHKNGLAPANKAKMVKTLLKSVTTNGTLQWLSHHSFA